MPNVFYFGDFDLENISTDIEHTIKKILKFSNSYFCENILILYECNVWLPIAHNSVRLFLIPS